MLYLVTGGSGSGKSAFAEMLAVQLKNKQKNTSLFYIATMQSMDEESEERINKHRRQRSGKGFLTKECPSLMEQKTMGMEDGVGLLEDLSNLLANEMYSGENLAVRGDTPFYLCDGILKEIIGLNEKMQDLIVVTNEIFSDGIEYGEETKQYQRQLGYLNEKLAGIATGVIEVVAGIPIWQKGEMI